MIIYFSLFKRISIIKKKIHSFLICRDEHVEYYKKFGWKKILNKEYKIIDQKVSKGFKNSKINAMLYNITKINKNKYYLN